MNEGDIIRVNTETGEYVERVSKADLFEPDCLSRPENFLPLEDLFCFRVGSRPLIRCRGQGLAEFLKIRSPLHRLRNRWRPPSSGWAGANGFSTDEAGTES